MKIKVGIIPYIKDNAGIIQFLLMIPSDPSFGGSFYQISKGHLNDGEDLYDGAVREGSEELGLKPNNIKNNFKVGEFILKGMTEEYKLVIFACEVKDQFDFNKAHYESAKVGWISVNDMDKVRKSHQKIVKKFLERLDMKTEEMHNRLKEELEYRFNGLLSESSTDYDIILTESVRNNIRKGLNLLLESLQEDRPLDTRGPEDKLSVDTSQNNKFYNELSAQIKKLKDDTYLYEQYQYYSEFSDNPLSYDNFKLAVDTEIKIYIDFFNNYIQKYGLSIIFYDIGKYPDEEPLITGGIQVIVKKKGDMISDFNDNKVVKNRMNEMKSNIISVLKKYFNYKNDKYVKLINFDEKDIKLGYDKQHHMYSIYINPSINIDKAGEN